MLTGKRVAILATHGVEEIELVQPKQVLKEAGADVLVVSPQPNHIQSMHQDVEPGAKIPVDLFLSKASAGDFDALVLPGGTTNPDTLRIDAQALAFVRHFIDTGKPIAAICHGPWTLLEAGGVQGRKVTSWPSLKTDLRNAGANWVDEPCVVDGPIITSRKPDDLAQFCQAVVAAIGNSDG
jgi:protease I